MLDYGYYHSEELTTLLKPQTSANQSFCQYEPSEMNV
jgi:hypothetical protein